MSVWRVGGKLKRTLYRDEQLVGLVDTPELAAEIVETMNRVGRLLDEVRQEGGRERSLWSDPVYADRCTECDHPAFMHHGDRCLGDFMSCTCATPEPPDAERRSEATPKKDLQAEPVVCKGCGRTSHGFACTAQLEAARREQDLLSRVDPYDTKKGFTP